MQEFRRKFTNLGIQLYKLERRRKLCGESLALCAGCVYIQARPLSHNEPLACRPFVAPSSRISLPLKYDRHSSRTYHCEHWTG